VSKVIVACFLLWNFIKEHQDIDLDEVDWRADDPANDMPGNVPQEPDGEEDWRDTIATLSFQEYLDYLEERDAEMDID